MRGAVAVGVAVLLGLFAAGCQRTQPTVISVGTIGSSIWSDVPEKGPAVPGIDEGSAYFAGKLFVVWTDSAEAMGGNSSGGPSGFSAEGAFTTRDRRRVPFSCVSPDGQAGQVQIDGTTYDLADGRLFLVASGGGKLRVKQLSIDLSRLRVGETTAYRAFAREEPQVSAFFKTASE